MIEVTRGLQPLREAEDAIAKLQTYESTAELAAAVQATHAAVQRSLRYLLRADKAAPDDLRLIALSANELAPDRLLTALRQRDLISLDLAGQIHELEQAAGRAASGNARAGDADLALRIVDQLRAEIQGLSERGMREVAHGTVEGAPLDHVHAVPAPRESRTALRVLIIAAAAVLLGLVLWLVVFRKSDTEKGIAYFEQARSNAAEQTLRSVVDDDPGDARAAYYLAILYRRTQRYDEAGQVLRRAIEKNATDVLLREELGNLFMDLARPELAARQYRAAQELNPGEPRLWVKLVGALRAAGDPEAETALQRAPEEARAMLRTGR